MPERWRLLPFAYALFDFVTMHRAHLGGESSEIYILTESGVFAPCPCGSYWVASDGAASMSGEIHLRLRP